MLRVAMIGGLLGGLYGIAHDQITYTISPEYFTKIKFKQFDYADLGFGDRFFVGTIGFIAVAAVGFLAAWFLARRHIPNQEWAVAYRKIRKSVLIVFAFALAFGVLGYLLGVFRGETTDPSFWDWVTQPLEIQDVPGFVTVAIIHYAGYIGGFVGLVVGLVFVKPM